MSQTAEAHMHISNKRAPVPTLMSGSATGKLVSKAAKSATPFWSELTPQPASPAAVCDAAGGNRCTAPPGQPPPARKPPGR
jgi:hypothetical protein